MKHIRWFALVLALCLALGLVGCGPAPLRETVRGSGVVVTRELGLPEGEAALRVGGISVQNFGEFLLIVDEGLGRKAVLETDNNISARLRLEYRAGTITFSAPRNTVFTPTRLTLTVGAPVRDLDVDGLWEVRYSCPSVRDGRLVLDGAAKGDFAFGEMDRLNMRFEGLGKVNVTGKDVRECRLKTDGSVNGDFTLGAVDRLDMDLSGLGMVNLNSTGVRDCRLISDGAVSGDFALGEMDRLDMNLSGLGKFKIDSTGVRDCKLRADGSVNGDFTLGEMDSLDMTLEGLGRVAVRGTAQRAVLRLDGGSSVSAFDLVAQDAEVIISGLGSCEITAEQNLKASVEGSGTITYGGNPKEVYQDVQGLGRVKPR